MAILFVVVVSTTSCQKKQTLGSQVIPGSQYSRQGEIVIDAIASSVKNDTLSSSNQSNAEYAMLGSINSTIHGKSNAAFAMNLSLPSITNKQKIQLDSAIVDSVVLQLKYSSIYGNKANNNSIINIKVYQLNKQLKAEDKFLTNYDYSSLHYNSKYYDLFVKPDNEKLITTSTDQNNMLVLKLDNELGRIFLNSLKNDVPIPINGLLIDAPNPNQSLENGAILLFNLIDPTTKLNVFYHTINQSTESKRITFKNSDRIFYNFFKTQRDNNNSVIKTINDSLLAQNNSYIEGFSGAYTKCFFNFENLFKDSGLIAINKAEVIIPTDPSKQTYVPVPELLATWSDETGKEFAIIDDFDANSATGFSRFAKYNASTKTYDYKVSVFLQAVINGDINFKSFQFRSSKSFNIPNKSVLLGGKNIKLKIKYTKL
jgi:hypothetical protein